jgi:hypothetical protein
MNSEIKEPTPPLQQSQVRRRSRQTPSITATQKAEAVLKVWAERSTPSNICREMNITWTILNHWQQRAMEGMLQALEPYVQLDKGTALSPRLQALLRKQAAFPQEKLLRRLHRLEKKTPSGG